MNSNDKSQSNRSRAFTLSQSNKHAAVNKNKPPVPAKLPNYRFVWIEPDASNAPKIDSNVCQFLDSCVTVRDINPALEHNSSSRNHSSTRKYSLIDYYNDGGEINNLSTTSLQYHSSMEPDNLLPKNKSYTAVVNSMLFENVSEKKKRIENNDYCSLSQNSKQDFGFENIQRTKLSKDCLITDCTELDDTMGNETIVQNNIESDICENDDQFEIAVLNNQQLEIKTIII